MNTNGRYRTEKDSLGEVKVPAQTYYGAETQRALENFQISGQSLPRSFIRAQGIIKASAAAANMRTGELPPDTGSFILQAAEEVIAGKWDDHFNVDIYQAGAGTSQNMNANEVIGNRATQLAGGTLGSKLIHPHDHVNMSQSTNDTFPSALHIAAAESIIQDFLPALSTLNQSLQRKSEELMGVKKSGRTHLHDAVPIRMGQEFAGYAGTIETLYKQAETILQSFYEIGLGGNAIGTPINTHKDYQHYVLEEICRRTNLPFRSPASMFTFMQNRNAAIQMMALLKELAIHLIKITSDLRLLSSGPRTGFAEINLPAVQPGSTIMPGKINPAILEMAYMVCCRIIGNDTVMAAAAMAGQLEINVMMPVIASTLLESIEIMSNAIKTLVTKCINGITANEQTCRQLMVDSLALVTGLSPKHGYDTAAQIGNEADEQNKSIKQILQEKGMLTEENLRAIDPDTMV
ncbi:class II fumarate hydratase [Evansella clarkii]|uniref:class II fumarate hydratase n=1 Tax=Evansella clarkii TaxID=79879 RepID=UPI000995F3C4|nr:aspartate ammonia-lyase [Evansella clarkii]